MVKKILTSVFGVIIMVIIIIIIKITGIDKFIYSSYFQFKKTPVTNEVVIVGVDQKSIEEQGGWPWSRAKIAKTVSIINQGAPKVAAFDLLLPFRDDPVGNDSLQKIFKNTQNLILPFQVDVSKNTGNNSIPFCISRHKISRIQNQEYADYLLTFKSSSIVRFDTTFYSNAATCGFINISSGRISKRLIEVLEIFKINNEYYPSFSLTAAALYLGLSSHELGLDCKGSIILGKDVLPISRYAASMLLNFRGPSGTIPTISATDLLNGKIDPSIFRDKLVFFGITDPGAGSDFFQTPVGFAFPGIEIWATNTLDILHKNWINGHNSIGTILEWLLALLIFPGVFLVFSDRLRLWAIISGAGLLVCAIVISVGCFQLGNTYLTPLTSLVSLALLISAIAVFKQTTVLNKDLIFEPVDRDQHDQLKPPEESDFAKEIPKSSTIKYVYSQILILQTGTLDLSGKSDALPSGDSFSSTYVEGSEQSKTVEQATLYGQNVSTAGSTAAPTKLSDLGLLCNGRIVKLLGSGGMADVYLTWNPRLEVYRAVKVLQAEHQENFKNRFETEIRIFSKLQHPNIVQCYGAGDWYGLPCVEMEYVYGASLEDFLQKGITLTAVQTIIVGILLCRALRYAHTNVVTIYGTVYKGIIHRDLKPANIMISRKGSIKLTDFGIARPESVSLHTIESGGIVGTLPYLSPEQINGKNITHSSDIYALGAVLYELFKGERVFSQDSVNAIFKAKITGEYGSLAKSGAPAGVCQIIDKALANSIADRYSDAEEMGKALEELLRAMLKPNEQPGQHLTSLVQSYLK